MILSKDILSFGLIMVAETVNAPKIKGFAQHPF